MKSKAKPRSSTRLPEPSIIFPVCVIVVALSAISPAFSVVDRDTGRPAAPCGIGLMPAVPPAPFGEEVDLEALDAWPSLEIDPAE